MRLIDADAVLAEAKRISGPVTGDGWDNFGVYALIERQKTIDAVPVVHGKWGNRQICSNMCGYEYAMMCSVCNKPTYRISMMEKMPPYCQFCGARMDKEENA